MGYKRVLSKIRVSPCIKAALEIQGFAVGEPIPPLKALSNQDKEELKQLLFSL